MLRDEAATACARRLREVLDHLPGDSCAAVVAVLLDDDPAVTQQAMAAVVGKDVGTVRRAMKRLFVVGLIESTRERKARVSARFPTPLHNALHLLMICSLREPRPLTRTGPRTKPSL